MMIQAQGNSLKKKHTLAELREMYKESEQCDSEVFSEQRSNILLVTGNHYNRKHSLYWNRIRESRTLTNETKLRLTANHIYRVSKIRKNLILTHAPGVQILPAQEQDSQSQKSAELNQAVWEFLKGQQNMRLKTQQFASDYFDLGEVCAKIWWNPNGGAFKGYEQAVDEESGELAVDPESGEPVPNKDRAVFEGALEIERFFSFNLLRDANSKTMDESPFLTLRKMTKVDPLLAMFDEEDERRRFITEGKDETFIVFDANKQNYQKEKGITTLKETYFRPSPCYPMGYYYIWVDGGILFEGELPFGIFPIIYEGHDEQATTARHRSPIKQLRPYQVEINRAKSAQAETQVTMGQDKIILQAGAKLTPGEILPGVRAYHATGRDPTVLEGRTGEQWVNYISANISELYDVAMIPEELQEKGQISDPWMELFKNMKQKKKFVMDAEKFEGFLCRVVSTALDLARHYFPDEMLIPAIGKSEVINIAEFRNTDKLSYRIKAEPMSDDMYSVMGKTLMINHVLQYASNGLAKEDIGKLVRLMPFANEEKSFDDFTLDYDRAENMILQLDRGEAPRPLKTDNGPYMIKKLSARTAKPDFPTLHDQIQANYQNMIATYEYLEAEKARQLKAMEADFIPTDGPMIKVAWYIKDPTNPDRSIQATLPANAINWLVQRLNDQNGATAQLMGLSQGNQADIAQFYEQGKQQPDAVSAGMPGRAPQPGGMLQ
jgi:hypothetical protein